MIKVVYVTYRLWNEVEFEYEDWSGVTNGTGDEFRNRHDGVFFIVTSVREL